MPTGIKNALMGWGALICLTLLAGCADRPTTVWVQPHQIQRSNYSEFNVRVIESRQSKDSSYDILSRHDGFGVVLLYTFPLSTGHTAAILMCHQRLNDLVHEHAQELGKSANTDKTKVSIHTNEHTGEMLCQASTIAKWVIAETVQN